MRRLGVFCAGGSSLRERGDAGVGVWFVTRQAFVCSWVDVWFVVCGLCWA